MAIFNSYVCLPEGTLYEPIHGNLPPDRTDEHLKSGWRPVVEHVSVEDVLL